MAQHNDLGVWGEQLAKDYLQNKGYSILQSNFRYKQFELDIIAQIGNDLVIVEVKTRQNDYLADPALMVSKSKQKGIIQAANAYIIENDLDLECRFDVITVVVNNKEHKLEHIEEAFYPTL